MSNLSFVMLRARVEANFESFFSLNSFERGLMTVKDSCDSGNVPAIKYRKNWTTLVIRY